VHFLGSVHLKQFAVYVHPSVSKSEQVAPTCRASLHTAYVPSPEYILEQMMGQIIPTRIDCMDIVLFKDFLGIIEPSDTASSSSSSSASGSCSGASSTTSCAAQVVVTATTHGKCWPCINAQYFLNAQVPPHNPIRSVPLLLLGQWLQRIHRTRGRVSWLCFSSIRTASQSRCQFQ
jgi:hypothetical protein